MTQGFRSRREIERPVVPQPRPIHESEPLPAWAWGIVLVVCGIAIAVLAWLEIIPRVSP